MPLEIIESTDPITRLVHFKTSPVYEMFISLQLIQEPGRRHKEWVQGVLEDLPREFLEEITSVLKPFRRGLIFVELAVDYPYHEDVLGFVEHVRKMPPATFLFYTLGRIIPLKILEAQPNLSYETVTKLLKSDETDYAEVCLKAPIDVILADIPAFQNQLADIWQYYWEKSFSKQVDLLRPQWESALVERERIFLREGGTKLMESIMGHFKLPPQLPMDMPTEEILVIPSYLLPSRAYMFFGYGNVTLLFDCTLTEARLSEIEQGKEQAILILRALGDNTRLSVLHVIAHAHGKIHGQKIAKILDLSPSVVSRHLNQLKDSGLIVEEPTDNRMIYYRIQEDAINSLPEKILDYLYT